MSEQAHAEDAPEQTPGLTPDELDEHVRAAQEKHKDLSARLESIGRS